MWFFGAGIVVNLVIASIAALAGEAWILKLRQRPIGLFLTDGSALVTAWLIALSVPPSVPWWLLVTATLIAIIIGNHAPLPEGPGITSLRIKEPR